MEEKELIAQCKRGDLKAFEILVCIYQSSVLSVAKRILGDRDEACDAAQDAFAQAFINIHMYDANRNFRAWILGITIKRCLDRLRRRKSFLHFMREYAGFIRLWENKDQHDARKDLKSYLWRLPEKERVIVTLQVEQGLSVPEIAEILRCSASTVRVHLFNARRRLRKEINRHVPSI